MDNNNATLRFFTYSNQTIKICYNWKKKKRWVHYGVQFQAQVLSKPMSIIWGQRRTRGAWWFQVLGVGSCRPPPGKAWCLLPPPAPRRPSLGKERFLKDCLGRRKPQIEMDWALTEKSLLPSPGNTASPWGTRLLFWVKTEHVGNRDCFH